MRNRFCCLAVYACCFFFAGVGDTGTIYADVKLPGFYGDHMVLQRQLPIRLRGWADPGETVSVQLGTAKAECEVGLDGHWSVTLPSQEANRTGQDLIFRGKNTVTIKDVLIGEVWLCSGQSNMEWTVAASQRSQEEIASANHPMIRHMKVAHRPSTSPLDDVPSQWQVCTPEVAGNFTACGYFMALHLQRELNVPIGLINSSWGGTRVEPWTPPLGFSRVDALSDIYQTVVQKTPSSKLYQDQLGEHLEATRRWIELAEVAVENQESVEASPVFPDAIKPFQSHQDPTMLYNGMIHALVGYTIRGAIWYQGESNHSEGMMYFEKKKALIEGWRELWGQGAFPFYYVQIAPFQYGNEDPTILAEFWEAQEAVEQIPNTAMVVINDIATLQDIHPPNKQDVGKRLALLALNRDYGRADLQADRPVIDKLEVTEGSLVLSFNQTGGALKTRDGKSPSHFEVIGAGSRGYQPADAEIVGDRVVLRSEVVSKPVAFRYAWNKLAEPNLTGATGLPVGAFRGGEEPDFLNLISIDEEYSLVYDLDLSRLGGEIPYKYNGSAGIDSFDRIGYLIELRTEGGDEQKIFVSMDAFTQDASKIAIPTVASKASFRQGVKNLDVFTTVGGLPVGTSIGDGTVEFWPNNYATDNGANVPGASNADYDFGDQPSPPLNGYGCMQIHLPSAKKTLFAINHWGAGPDADLGIGNAPGANTDWTFSGNAKSYSSKRLRVYVRETK